MSINRPSSLVLIRHAESQRNAMKGSNVYFPDNESRSGVMGIPDHKISLTERGVDQARKTGIYLHERFGVPDYLYHSGYERTVQTSKGILDAFSDDERKKVRVLMNPSIREREPGYTYDMTQQEADCHFPYLAQHWKTFGGFFARPPGGENMFDVTERVYTFLNMLFRDRPGQKVWVVTHGGTLKAFRFVLERWTYDQALQWAPGESPHNCGITWYEYDATENKLVLRAHNTVAWK